MDEFDHDKGDASATNDKKGIDENINQVSIAGDLSTRHANSLESREEKLRFFYQ